MPFLLVDPRGVCKHGASHPRPGGNMATGTLRVMDPREGDTKLTWDTDNDHEVDAARALFDELRTKRFMAYSVDERGGRGEVIRQFDPEAGLLIMAPPMVGG